MTIINRILLLLCLLCACQAQAQVNRIANVASLTTSNTFTKLNTFNAGLVSSASTTAASGGSEGTFAYYAPQPSGAGSGSYSALYASIQYNSSGNTSNAVYGIKSVAELFGQGGGNQTIGITGTAQADANGGAYGASQSLYGRYFYPVVQGTSTFNHAIGVKLDAPIINGNTTFTSGLYIADQTNIGSATISSQDALHIEGSGAVNAIAWGNGSSGIHAQIYSPSSNTLAVKASSGLTITGPVTANITSGVYASKPSASAGLLYDATDMGTNGTLLMASGSAWKPATGTAVIAVSGVQVTHTGDTSESNLATIALPAGVPSANGCLRVHVDYLASGANSTRSFNARYSASSGGSSGTSFASYSGQAASVLSISTIKYLCNRNSASSQISSSASNTGAGTSSGANQATAINSANASFINLTCIVANAGDTCGLDDYEVEDIEP